MPRYRTEPHDAQAPFRDPGQAEGDGPELESMDTTYADDGNEIFFVSGYSAREISQRRHQEQGGTIWVNSVSRKIVRHDCRRMGVGKNRIAEPVSGAWPTFSNSAFWNGKRALAGCEDPLYGVAPIAFRERSYPHSNRRRPALEMVNRVLARIAG